MTFINKPDLGFRAQQSADGRQRISSQISLGDYKQYLNTASGQYDDELLGGGTSTYEDGLIGGTKLGVSTTGDAAIRQTYQWHNYFAGKPQKIELTASRFDKEVGVEKRFGYFSSDITSPYDTGLDGFYFDNDGTDIRCVVSRAGTEVFSLTQDDWLNQSELGTFDPANFNFYVIDFLYLGGAVVNFWVLTQFGLTKVASYQHINVDVSTFVKSPNQPVRYEIRSNGGAGTFNHICCDVATEGLAEQVGSLSTYNTDSNGLSSMASGNRYALLGIRQAAASRNVIFSSRILSVVSSSNDDLLIEIVFGGSTVGTPSWAAIPFSNAEGFKGYTLGTANAIHSGGVPIYSAYIGSNEGSNDIVDTTRRLGSFIDGTTEELYLCVTPVSPGAEAFASLNWIEFI